MPMLYPLLVAPLALTIQQSPPAATATSGETASALLFSKDTRLSQKVTLSATTITLNDALKQITEQTGISVKMRDKKVLGEQKVCVFAKEIETKQLLESIAALLRYKNISSEWQKDATGEGYALSIGGQYYVNLARKANEAGQSPVVTRVFTGSDGQPITVTQVSGGDVLASGTGEVRTFSVTLAKPIEGVPVQGAQNVVVDAKNGSAPTITLNGQKLTALPITGSSAASGAKLKKPVAEDWFTRYDDLKNGTEEKMIPPADPANVSAAKDAPASNTLARLLFDISRQQNIPVVAILPDSGQDGISASAASASGKTISSLLTGLTTSPYKFSYKWHKGALLLRNPLAPF